MIGKAVVVYVAQTGHVVAGLTRRGKSEPDLAALVGTSFPLRDDSGDVSMHIEPVRLAAAAAEVDLAFLRRVADFAWDVQGKTLAQIPPTSSISATAFNVGVGGVSINFGAPLVGNRKAAVHLEEKSTHQRFVLEGTFPAGAAVGILNGFIGSGHFKMMALVEGFLPYFDDRSV